MKNFFKIVFFLIVMASNSALFAQFDTLFWFAAPEVAQADRNFDRPIYIWLSSSNAPSQVTITQPANSSFAPIVVNLAANSTQFVNLTPWIDQIETKPANQVLNYGIKVSATNPVNAYYEILSLQCMCSPEIYVLKGRNSLGTQFMIPIQNFLNNANDASYTPTPYSSFVIVATENNTNVTITTSADVVGHNSNTPYTITLNEGQTYSATATSQLSTQHLNGSVVTSDKPIAITINDDLIYGGTYGTCADVAGDQIIPVNILGTKFIVVRGFLTIPYDKVFILATQNNTTVQVNGTTLTTINSGQTYMYSMNLADAVYIETSHPVYTLQLSGFGCEIGNCLVPQIECSGSHSVTFTRSTNDPLHLMLIVPTGGETNFQVNGNPTLINAPQFSFVPGTNNTWKYAKITFSTSQIPSGVSTTITNSLERFHLGFIHGTPNNGCRFGFFSDFGKYKYEITANGTHFCVGDTLQLTTNGFPGATYNWTGPNGFSSTSQSFQINSLNFSNQGLYIVNGTVESCIVEPDSIYIQVDTTFYASIFSNDTILCVGDTLILYTNLNFELNFDWHTPFQIVSNQDSLQLPNIQLNDQGMYSIEGMANNCSIISDSVMIQVQQPPDIQIFADDTLFCDGDSMSLSSTYNPNVQYFWTGPVGFTSQNQNIHFDQIHVQQSGIYILNAQDGVCSIFPDSIEITVHPTPDIVLNPFPNHICLGDSVFLEFQGADLYVYLNDTLNQIWLYPTENLNFTIWGTNSFGCTDTFTSSIFVHPIPEADFYTIPDTTIIYYPYFDFYSNSNTQYWNWNFGDGQSTHNAPPIHHEYEMIDTTYLVQLIVKNDIGCADTITKILVVNDLPLIFPNVITPNSDGMNDFFVIVNGDRIENQVYIYDRWGKLIYQKENYKNDWNGEGFPSGTYYYVFDYFNKTFHSTLTILK